MSLFTTLRRRYHYSVVLLRQLVVTDFKLRYQGSVLGYLWSLLRPLFLFVILYVVFVKFLPIGNGTPHYSVYLLTGIVFWNFFTEMTTGQIAAIVSKGDLIRKINFPKYVIIIAGALSALINLALNLVVIGVFLYFNHVPLTWGALWALPLIAEIFVFGLAFAFLLSALFVRLRDVNYIWEVIMQAFFYATPIIYPLSRISEKSPHVAEALLMNPVGQAIQDIRYTVITKQSETISSLSHHAWLTLIPYCLVALTFIGAAIFFRVRSPLFAEEV